jgi:hypothetical protein
MPMLCRGKALCGFAFLVVALAVRCQTVTFSTTTYSNDNLWNTNLGFSGHVRADLNGDGREDFISGNNASWSSDCAGSFAVSLSTGDGTYAAPVCYAIPTGYAQFFAIGDFYGEGTLDVVVTSTTNDIYLYKNDGSGNLTLASTITLSGVACGIVAADVNHDGKLDLVYDLTDPSGTGASSLNVLFGNSDGTFTPGPTTNFTMNQEPAGALTIGDFDNDSHVDVLVTGAAQVESEILYGDGQGNFIAGPTVGGTTTQYQPFDLLSDGTMDLIGAPFVENPFGHNTYYNYLDIEWGHFSRTLTSQHVPLKSCTAGNWPPVVADFNGDGKNDLVVAEAADCQGDGPFTLNLLLGNGDGTFQPEQVIYQSDDWIAEWHLMRASRSSKPDLTVWQGQLVDSELSNPEELVLVNTTEGSFPSCTPLNYKATGINVCSPTSTTGSSSPVTFSFGANNQTPGRDMEIWVDGQKLDENLKNTYSYYSFVQGELTLTNGLHTVAVYSVGWDYSLMMTEFLLNVGSSACPQPRSGLNVCSPIGNATVTSPVLAQASGATNGAILRMEVWVDGVKEFSTFGQSALDAPLKLSPGWHQFTYYLVDTEGGKQSVTFNAAVQ